MIDYNEGDDQITLRTRNGFFTGHDFGTSSHFSGKVSGRTLNLYDCENGLSFAFRVEG